MRTHRILPLVAVAVLGAAAPAVAAPLSAETQAQITAVTQQPRYVNSTWGIAITDAVTGESVYAQNAQEMFVPGSITKAFTAAAALETLGVDRRFRTPVHRVGPVRRGVLDGDLVLVAQGDFSFGLRERPDGTMVYADGGADHNEANTLGFVTSVSGNPLRALDRLARDVRARGIRRVDGDVIIDDRLFQTETGWPDGPVGPMWVNENLIDITVRPTARGRAATMSYRPRTAAYRVVSSVRTGRAGSPTALEVEELRPGVVRISGTLPANGPSAVRTWLVDDAPAFARTAFIEALRRAGVTVDAESTGPNPAARLPRGRTYPASTRLGQWTSPTFDQYVKVVLKVSYNRGADLLACLVGVRAGVRDCQAGLGRAAGVLTGLGVPDREVFNFDGAGSDDRNKITPNAINTLMRVAAGRPWGAVYRDALPQLGTPGGGDLAVFGQTLPSRGRFQGKTGTRAGAPPGASAGLLGSRGLGGYLQGQSGRQLHATIMLNNLAFTEFDQIFGVIEDQVNIINTAYLGS
jgi:D-alanyl-D-alanine carboxypeptidase/D-alanyl-D-alanine-endopeptidase (penicillin-binding protein 4)